MKNKRKKNGFTIVEILVTIAIVTLISAGLILSNARFGANFLLTNLAYDIASTLQEFQSFGLSTKSWKSSVTTLGEGFDVGYGMRFASKDVSATGEKKFLAFYDKQDSVSGVFNSRCGFSENNSSNPNAKLPNTLSGCRTITEEFMKEYLISGQNKIYKICALYDAGEHCYNFETGGTGEVEYLDIVFMRPSFGQGVNESDIRISTNLSFYPNNYSSAKITLKNQSGFTKDVVINRIGRISVE